MPNPDFEAMHREMRAYVLRTHMSGWSSPDVEKYATRLLHCLSVLASSEKPHPAVMLRLAEDPELLAAALAAAGDQNDALSSISRRE